MMIAILLMTHVIPQKYFVICFMVMTMGTRVRLALKIMAKAMIGVITTAAHKMISRY